MLFYSILLNRYSTDLYQNAFFIPYGTWSPTKEHASGSCMICHSEKPVVLVSVNVQRAMTIYQ